MGLGNQADSVVDRATALVARLEQLAPPDLVELAELAVGDLRQAELVGGDMVGTPAYPVVRDACAALARRHQQADGEVQLAIAYVLSFFLEFAASSMELLEAAAKASSSDLQRAGLELARARLHASVSLWQETTPDVPFDGIAPSDRARALTGLGRSVAVIEQVLMLPRFPRKCDAEVAAALDAVEPGTVLGPWGGGDLSVFTCALRETLWVQRKEATDAKNADDADSEDDDIGEDDADSEDDDIGEDDVVDPFTQQRRERQAPRKELAGLRSVDWASLEHAYGNAVGVPGMIDALSSPDEEDRSWALDALSGSIHHQGSVYSASAAAVPFLVELVKEPWLEGRERILDLLCGIAVHNPDGCVVQGARRWRSEAYDAVASAGSTYAELLSAPDAMLRSSAAHLLAYVEPPPAGALEALQHALEVEPDRRARASLLLALGYVSKYLQSNELRASLERELDSDTPLLRAASAIALHQMLGSSVPDSARAVLIRTPSEAPPVRGHFPWLEGNIGQFAQVIRSAFETDDDRWQHIERALTHGQTPESGKAAARLFGTLFRDDAHGYDRPWLPAELDAPRRKLLEYFLLTAHGEGSTKSLAFWEVAGETGLFSGYRDIEGLLGRTSCILDRAVGLGEDQRPLFAWFIASHTDAGVKALQTALDGWSPSERIELADAVLDGTYALTSPRWHTEYGADDDHPHSSDRANDYTSRCLLLLAELLDGHDSIRQWAERLASEQAALGEDRNTKKAVVAALVLTRAGRFPSELEALIAMDRAPASTYRKALRVVLERLPIERAEPIVLKDPLYGYHAYVDPRGQVRRWSKGDGWDILDLAPPYLIVAKVLGALEEWERHRSAGDDRSAAPVIGTTESSIDNKPGADDAFPRERAIELLASAGRVAVEALDRSLAAGTIRDVELLSTARQRALDGQARGAGV